MGERKVLYPATKMWFQSTNWNWFSVKISNCCKNSSLETMLLSPGMCSSQSRASLSLVGHKEGMSNKPIREAHWSIVFHLGRIFGLQTESLRRRKELLLEGFLVLIHLQQWHFFHSFQPLIIFFSSHWRRQCRERVQRRDSIAKSPYLVRLFSL